MLGYVRTMPSELRLREQECYRALYCGLCKSMGKCTGICSRMTLSYDFVFLALVRITLAKEPLHIHKEHCIAHPLRRRPVAKDSAVLDYCAHASALLTYQKLIDDLHDERGIRRAASALLRPFLSTAYRRAKRKYPLLDRAIAEQLEVLHRYEQCPEPPSADIPAEQFGVLMGEVFAHELEGEAERLARTIGNVIGRWIYLADAADDFAKDIKKARFNPYHLLFEGEAVLSVEQRESIRISLIAHLSQAERAYLLMEEHEAPELHALLANILYLGLPQTAQRILDISPDNTCKTNAGPQLQ